MYGKSTLRRKSRKCYFLLLRSWPILRDIVLKNLLDFVKVRKARTSVSAPKVKAQAKEAERYARYSSQKQWQSQDFALDLTSRLLIANTSGTIEIIKADHPRAASSKNFRPLSPTPEGGEIPPPRESLFPEVDCPVVKLRPCDDVAGFGPDVEEVEPSFCDED